MDIRAGVLDPLLMAKNVRQASLAVEEPTESTKPLYLGQWIRAVGKRPVDVVKATDINFGYLSGLIAGKKKNPSADKLRKIADFLEIPMDDLYKPPPAPALLDQVNAYGADVIAKLARKRRS